MKRFIILTVAILCPILACTRNEDNRPDEVESILAGDVRDRRSREANKIADVLRNKIRAEVKRLGNHQWSGEYYMGNGTGVNITVLLAPKSGYLFEWHGCEGLYDRNYGAVAWNDGKLRLTFTFPNERKPLQGIAPEFIRVAWGKRTYLVPSDDVVGFCNKVNDGSEPRKGMCGRYLLRLGDEELPVAGFPAVPKEYKSYLLTSPIDAEIVDVGQYTTRPAVFNEKDKDTPVVLNCGKKHGLLSGMELHVVEPKDVFESVTITKVEDARSEGVMTQFGEEKKGPQVGWKLSTQLPADRKWRF